MLKLHMRVTPRISMMINLTWLGMGWCHQAQSHVDQDVQWITASQTYNKLRIGWYDHSSSIHLPGDGRVQLCSAYHPLILKPENPIPIMEHNIHKFISPYFRQIQKTLNDCEIHLVWWQRRRYVAWSFITPPRITFDNAKYILLQILV